MQEVRKGNFGAIPTPLTWSDTAHLSHAFNGYNASLELGMDELSKWANQQRQTAHKSGVWNGTAVELWLCLFYEHRRYRHFGEGEPGGEDRIFLDQLCEILRNRLVAIGHREKRTLINLLRGSSKLMISHQ